MHSRDRTRHLPPPTPESLAQDAEDQRVYERCRQYVLDHAAGGPRGLFGPDSVTWTLWREPALLVAGVPAVMLQLGHPAIATGVALLSDFREDILGRARRTFISLYQLVFGDLDDALSASRRLHLLHRRVRGVIEDPGGPLHGKPFRANDQDLLIWVGSTVSVLGRRVFERMVRPLTPAERIAWFQEYRIISAASGILPENQPADIDALDAWFEAQVHGSHMRLTPLARDVASALFNSAYTRGPLDEIVCAGLLPPEWREVLGLRWGAKEKAIFASFAAGLRGYHRAWPVAVRAAPGWHQGMLRVARAEGRRESLIGRGINALDRKVDLPFSIQPIADDITEPEAVERVY